MNNKQNPQEIALFRYSVIAPIVNGTAACRSNADFYAREAAVDRKWVDGRTIRVSGPTIQRWYLSYVRSGFNSLLPRGRSDRGKTRKLGADTVAKIS